MEFKVLDNFDVETKKFWEKVTRLCRSIENIKSAYKFLNKIKAKMQTKHSNLIGRKSRFNQIKEILNELSKINTTCILKQIGDLPTRTNSRVPWCFIETIQDLYDKLCKTRSFKLDGSEGKDYKDNHSIESLKKSLIFLYFTLFYVFWQCPYKQ